MNEAPEKIWLDSDMTAWKQYSEDDTPYIRADIVDELVEALKAVVRYVGNSGDDYLADKVRAALKKLEEEQ